MRNLALGTHNQAQSSKQPYQPSSTYRPPQPQYQAALPPRVDSNFEDRMLNMMGEITGRFGEMANKIGDMAQTVNLHSQSIAKLEAHVGQIANSFNRREEGKLPSQPVVNPKRHYKVNEDASHHQQVQAITTLRSGRPVDNHVEKKKNEHTEAS